MGALVHGEVYVLAAGLQPGDAYVLGIYGLAGLGICVARGLGRVGARITAIRAAEQDARLFHGLERVPGNDDLTGGVDAELKV